MRGGGVGERDAGAGEIERADHPQDAPESLRSIAEYVEASAVELAAAETDGVRDGGNSLTRPHFRDDLVDEHLLLVATCDLEHGILENGAGTARAFEAVDEPVDVVCRPDCVEIDVSVDERVGRDAEHGRPEAWSEPQSGQRGARATAKQEGLRVRTRHHQGAVVHPNEVHASIREDPRLGAVDGRGPEHGTGDTARALSIHAQGLTAAAWDFVSSNPW